MALVRYQEGRLADSCKVIVPDNQIVDVQISLDGVVFNFEFIFYPHDDPSNPENRLSWANQPSGVTRFSFYNWNFQMGATTAAPISIGNLTSGSSIFLTAHHVKINNYNVCELQFLLGPVRS